VPEDKDLEFFRATRPPQQPHQREQIPHNEIQERPEQTPLPSTTARTTNLASPTLRRAADEFANPTRFTRAREYQLTEATSSITRRRLFAESTLAGRPPIHRPIALAPSRNHEATDDD
jgi:hypothetical protein